MKNVIISTSRMVKSIMLLAMLLLTYSAWGQQNWLPNHLSLKSNPAKPGCIWDTD